MKRILTVMFVAAALLTGGLVAQPQPETRWQYVGTTRVDTVQDKPIRTIEGLAKEGKLHPLQEAFVQHDALQCGFCTCGMIMSALGLLTKDAEPSREDIVRGMNGNICRCGAYPRIVAAVEQAAKAMKGGGK